MGYWFLRWSAMSEPANCAGCGRPTQSHSVAIDVSDVDRVGLPTLAGVVCHRCWIGETEATPAIGSIDEKHRLRAALDADRLVAVDTPVEAIDGE